RGTSGRARPSRELSDIIEPPQGGGFGGAEEAVLDRGGELAQQGDGGIGLLEQQGGGALALVQRPQQLPGAPALDPGAHRLQGGAQFRRGETSGRRSITASRRSSWKAIERGRVASVSSRSSRCSGWSAA